ncbi:uncharacterized protein LOC143467902 [Clavelina lepadiformis]|uniref:Uncharacterized protein n=1 Tax=Clavelina lepadiformis TaxID=159417 RepID=A0ABP0G430_CLALP
MKRIVVVLCLVLSLTRAQQEDCDRNNEVAIATYGQCVEADALDCTHTCTGTPIVDEVNCTLASHCCFINNQCKLKTIVNPRAVTVATVDLPDVQAQLLKELQQAKIETVEDDKVTERGLSILPPFLPPSGPGGFPPTGPGGFPPTGPGGFPGFYPPRLPSHCAKFPDNCPVNHGPQIDLRPPVNVPYCQRIPCSQSNPLLDQDLHQCIRQPGCAFDYELFQYRSILRQAVLPGVPVCHLAVRNRVFQQKANEFVQQYGSWNPLLTKCLIKEYQSEIFGGSPGCYMINVLEHFGHYPKRAGWSTITESECYLIDGCWKITNTGGTCVYPLELNHVTVRSGNDEEDSQLPDPRGLYGVPSCMPFNSAATGAEFLSSYHTCLATGCAINVDRNTYWQQLYSLGTDLPLHLQQTYLNMIYSGQVRADNFKEILEQLKASAGFGNVFSTHTFPVGSIDPLIAYSLNLTSSQPRHLQFPNVGAQNPNLHSSLLGGLGGQGSIPGFGNLGGQFPHGFYPGHHQPACPYKPVKYINLPPLSGSFEGCCEKPLCYIPRPQIYHPFSGVSSYLTYWSAWSQCSVSCGGGKQTRTRTCVGGKCPKGHQTEQTKYCNENPCPYYHEWTDFSSCSVSCGGGVRTRSRVCSVTGQCQGISTETTPCKPGACPTYNYGEWTPCSAEYGEGQKQRTVSCLNGGAYGCPGDRIEYEECAVYYGNVVHQTGVCNPNTCMKTSRPQCVTDNGSPGYCEPSQMRPRSVPCIDNLVCYCKAYPTAFGCNRSLNLP